MYVPASSRQDVPVYWSADLIGADAEIAIILRTVPETEPADADYKPAAWDGTSGTATIKVGPGDDATLLVAGEYVIWGRIVDGTNRPVHRAGILTVGPPPAL
ncbi:hypothetical protein OIE13_06015 [Streptosporangium sp. NBC_01810]|uniref:hypothetical protein n=1 Tax=Streptosporangium sp. NBC_01810 TaxID=2975951 RepID=UPI002DDAEC0D|nr:hypothetical protein [Streptosporangium sp. NBC_01810]WSA27429.1 hypothetical protein OIE13_06015 [Streptosporangium sp. NBC_01810]